MPVHDWSRVSAAVFHDFHHAWVGRLRDVLNERLLPNGFYAMSEQQAGQIAPDVLSLQRSDVSEWRTSDSGNVQAVADAPPKVWQMITSEQSAYILKRRTLAIRSTSHDRLVALIEVVSPGNKSGVHPFGQFVDKAIACFERELHLLVIDLHKPTKRDPQGIHGAIIRDFDESEYRAPDDKKLTLVSYESGIPLNSYIQPIAVGDVLPDMPLFIDRGLYVNVPLEETYQAGFQGMAKHYKQQLME
jgi:hypothetical protein